jgi:hypothetical protein
MVVNGVAFKGGAAPAIGAVGVDGPLVVLRAG